MNTRSIFIIFFIFIFFSCLLPFFATLFLLHEYQKQFALTLEKQAKVDQKSTAASILNDLFRLQSFSFSLSASQKLEALLTANSVDFEQKKTQFLGALLRAEKKLDIPRTQVFLFTKFCQSVLGMSPAFQEQCSKVEKSVTYIKVQDDTVSLRTPVYHVNFKSSLETRSGTQIGVLFVTVPLKYWRQKFSNFKSFTVTQGVLDGKNLQILWEEQNDFMSSAKRNHILEVVIAIGLVSFIFILFFYQRLKRRLQQEAQFITLGRMSHLLVHDVQKPLLVFF